MKRVGRRRPVPIHFTMEKPAWWRRHVVMLHMGSHSSPIMRSWSWDRAGNLMDRLNASIREQQRALSRVPVEAGDVFVEVYRPGSHDCCCGNSECSDFEDRMVDQGIPLSEITTVTYEERLG